MNVAFVYPNSRSALLAAVAEGAAPDTNLLGQNHLGELGIDSWVHESFLRRGDAHRGLLHRLSWYGRELTLPFELSGADVVCTPLATLLPLAARAVHHPRTVVISYHLGASYSRASRARRRLQRTVARAADHVVCVSTEGARLVVEEVGVDAARVTVATLGVDERYWTALPPATDGYVLTVGRDLARDYTTFGAALSTLDVQGVVIAKAENLRGVSLPRNVEVRLNASAAEVRELYAGAACVVVPVQAEHRNSGTENSGTIALLESMASARATIVTDRRFLADYVEPGRTAVTVPAEQPDALRARIDELLTDRDYATRLGRAARIRIEETHTTRHFAARLAGVLSRLDESARH